MGTNMIMEAVIRLGTLEFIVAFELEYVNTPNATVG